MSDLSERPKCVTCIHYDGGLCQKEPPSLVVVTEDGATAVLPWIPPVEPDYGCSHHPAFPAWAAGPRHPTDVTPPDSPG